MPSDLKPNEDSALVRRDPIVTDGDKYKVVFENDRVRVLEYRDSPGQKTTEHDHPDFVLCALSSFKRTLTLADKVVTREFKVGEVAWGKAQTHIGTNIGDTDTHVLIVELKELPPPTIGSSSSSPSD
jgi:hypothetical protein